MSDAKAASPAADPAAAAAAPAAAAAAPAPASAGTPAAAADSKSPVSASSPSANAAADRDAAIESAAKAAWEAALAAVPAAPTAAVGADDKSYSGSCLCGKVVVTAVGKPTFVGFCHCTICARMGGTDRAVVAAWPKANFALKSGRDALKGYASTPKTQRFFCRVCGSGVFNCPAELPFYGCSPTLFGAAEGFRVPPELAPAAHLFYGSSCLAGTGIRDGSGLALFKDVSKELGGSGEIIKE